MIILLLQLRFPLKRTFLLFACLYDATMIDKSFGSGTIAFELSLGSSGYLSSSELSGGDLFPSLSVSYPPIPIENNTRHFRLPIDLQKPIVSTKYVFHDYSFRMVLSNRLKRAADHLVSSFTPSLVDRRLSFS